MRRMQYDLKPLAVALIVAGMLSACGGGSNTTSGGSSNTAGGSQQQSGNDGGSSGNNSGNNSGNTDSSAGGSQNQSAPTVMACADGANYQCSGKNVAVADGIAFTEFGVQTYARSTSDVNHHPGDADWPTWATKAEGMQLDSGGSAEVRLAREGSSTISPAIVVLDNIGLSWDGKAGRPKIIETFNPTQGRVTLANDTVVADRFHESGDTGFYDYATKGVAGNQDHYANNRYFPRTNNPPRCGAGYPASCVAADPTRETDGPHNTPGNWAVGQPDTLTALRFHEDGDIHAGDALDGGWLAGGTGHGAPFPGSKGYRALYAMSFQYANLADWFTQDTVSIAEWTGANGSAEHNSNRRGIVAFGALTNPALLPASGTATYSGRIHGRYAQNNVAEPAQFEGTVTIRMDFAGKTATITVTPDGGASPVAFTASATLGKGAGNLANALSGNVNNGKLSGSVTGRYFGPVVSSGSGGTGPAEAGGAFALKNASSGEAVIGGFIARKQ